MVTELQSAVRMRERNDVLRGAWVVAYRELLRFISDRTQWTMAFTMPIMTLVIFGAGFNRLVGSSLGPGTSFMHFIIPGVVAQTVLMGSLDSGLSIVFDRELGFLKELLVAPLSRYGIIFGKAIGGSAVALMQGLVLVVVSPLFGLSLNPLRLVALIGTLIVVALSLCGIGILIASRMKRQRHFHLLLNIIVFPLMFLSGIFYPLSAVPSWLRVVATLNPVTYGVDAIRHVMLGVVPAGRVSIGLTVMGHQMTTLQDLVVLAAFGLLIMALAVRGFTRPT